MTSFYEIFPAMNSEPRVSEIYNIGVFKGNVEFMWRGLETGERRAFSEFFQPFRAEPQKLYIYPEYTDIVFILQ